MEKVFKDFYSGGVRSAVLTGGEPSLRPDVIQSAYRIFDNLTIVSNGMIRISDEIQTRLFISLDGPREVHDRIRGRNSFDTIIENISGDRRVVLTPTLSTTNFRYIDELVRITREAGVEGITFSTYTSHMKEGDPLLLQGDDLRQTTDALRLALKRNGDIVMLTKRIIDQFSKKTFYRKCYLRNRKQEVSYDARMKQKEPCVLGEGVNCSTCGCIVPVIAHTMSRADIGSWLIFDRMYPERYYSRT